MKPLRRFYSQFPVREKIILRDFLAMERTTLANERTLFSYIRTALYLFLGGFAFLNLDNFSKIRSVGYLLFGIAAFLIILGIVRFFVLKRKLSQFYDAIDLDEEKLQERIAKKGRSEE